MLSSFLGFSIATTFRFFLLEEYEENAEGE
jgi:hypothetical protein